MKNLAATKFDNLFRKNASMNMPHVIKCTKDVDYICFYCKLVFSCEGSLSVHLTTLQHIGLPNAKYRMNPEFQCNTCGSDVPMNHILKHACVEKAYKNYWELVRFVDEYGSPNMCLLCRGLLFETPSHLNAHMLISHNWKDFENDHKDKQSATEQANTSNERLCPFCLSIFKTNDLTILHRHVFDDHIPEFGITMLNGLSGFSRAKYGSVNDLKQWIAKRIYSCNFPNFRVKRYPVTHSKHINRLIPGFSSKSCTETFSSLFNLSSHLCTYHFIDDISKTNTAETRLTANQQRFEEERRFQLMQQEIELRKRTLIGKGIIIDKINASNYCLECFRLYDTNFELQVHSIVFHLNMSWHICGICNYDCKLALSLPANRIDEPILGVETSYTLLWNALWNHEKSHLTFFSELAKNPDMEIPTNCMMDFPSEVKPILEPVTVLISRQSIENAKLNIPKYIFTLEQISAFVEIGAHNVRTQTEFMINEALNERVS